MPIQSLAPSGLARLFTATNGLQREISDISQRLVTGRRVVNASDDINAYVRYQVISQDVGTLRRVVEPALDGARVRLQTTIGVLEEIRDKFVEMRNAVNRSIELNDDPDGTLTIIHAGGFGFGSTFANASSIDGINLLNGDSVTVAINEDLGTITLTSTTGTVYPGALATFETFANAQPLSTAAGRGLADAVLNTLEPNVETDIAGFAAQLATVEAAAAVADSKALRLEAQAAALVDADTAKESAQLTALRTQLEIARTVFGLLGQERVAVRDLFTGRSAAF